MTNSYTSSSLIPTSTTQQMRDVGFALFGSSFTAQCHAFLQSRHSCRVKHLPAGSNFKNYMLTSQMCHFFQFLLSPLAPSLHHSHIKCLSQLHFRSGSLHKARRGRYLADHHSKGSSRKIQIMGHRGNEEKKNKAAITAQGMRIILQVSEEASWKWRLGTWQGRNLVQRKQCFINVKSPQWAKGSKLSSSQSASFFNGIYSVGLALGPELSLSYLLSLIVCKEQTVPSHSGAPQRSKSLERIHLRGCGFWKASVTHLLLWVLHESLLCQSR